MTHTKDEALKLALEALEGLWNDGLEGCPMSFHKTAITAIKQSLAAPTVQEPVTERYRVIGPMGDEYWINHKPMSNCKILEVQPLCQCTQPAAQPAPVQEPVAIDELIDIFHRAWQKDFKESVLGGMSSGSEELKGQWREHVKSGIRALLAAQPAPVQYTALEQALTRLQKRYAELEAKVAAQPAPVPLTDEQRRNLWASATIESPSHENCYYRGIADSEAYHGITKGQP